MTTFLPPLPEPPAGMKPRWEHSWRKGTAWARGKLATFPSSYDPRDALASLAPADRRVIEENTMHLADLDRVEVVFRGNLLSWARPAVLREADALHNRAEVKARSGTVDDRAFWSGVRAYTAEVQGSAAMAGLEAFIDAVEANIVRAWIRNRRAG